MQRALDSKVVVPKFRKVQILKTITYMQERKLSAMMSGAFFEILFQTVWENLYIPDING